VITKNSEILCEITVVSLALNAPGPVAVARLQKMGARVIKIEPPGGDPLSEICPTWYAALRAEQEVLRLDLKSEAQRKRLDELLTTADLLITSMRPSALRRLELEFTNLQNEFPRLSHVEIVGHPPPHENLAGHDLTYQAALGLLAPPALPRTLLADLACAERVVSASLALLFRRERSQNGGHAQISLVESARQFAEPLHFGATAENGILGGGLPQYNLYQTGEGWLAVAALEPHFWQRLQNELQLTEPTRDELAKVFLTRTAVEWEAWASVLDLPLVAVREAENARLGE
jgi:crotonobetainyl-CoA:carnitine CoA-transferase CaiB-like acyl-CoA transferase